MLFLSALNKAWFDVLRVNQMQDIQLDLALSADVLRKDLLGASMSLRDWKESSFIFKTQLLDSKNKMIEEWVRWYVSDLGLMRADGKYDCIKEVWQSNDVSLVSRGVSKIELQVEKDGGIVTGANVRLWLKKTLTGQNKLLEYPIYVTLRNRVWR